MTQSYHIAIAITAAIASVALIGPGRRAGAQQAPAGGVVQIQSMRSTQIAPSTAPLASAFDKMDRNHDGVIDQAEWGVGREESFLKRDINRDGRLTPTEYDSEPVPANLTADLVTAYMLRWDANRDGLLQRSEFTGIPRAFVEADTDEDNALHHAELMMLLGSERPIHYLPAKFMGAHDLDHDGNIAESEWFKTETNGRLFAAVDANRNGVLSDTEVKEFLFRYERRLAPLLEPAATVAVKPGEFNSVDFGKAPKPEAGAGIKDTAPAQPPRSETEAAVEQSDNRTRYRAASPPPMFNEPVPAAPSAVTTPERPAIPPQAKSDDKPNSGTVPVRP